MFHEEPHSKSSGLTLSPKTSFIFGIVAGVLVLCTLGFFILLSLVVRGSVGVQAKKANNPVAAAPSPSPSPSPVDDSAPVVGELKEVTASDHIRGAKNAKITLVEYSDFECPFCQRFHPTMQQLLKDYDGKVRWVYRHFPLSFHPNAVPAANASECAAEQGRFWEFADAVFDNTQGLGDELYSQTAAKLGLKKPQFDDCYQAKKYQARITSDERGGATAGITGTPGTIILAADGGKQLVPGAVPYEQLKAMVDAALAAK